jgi:hypothetical protein
MNKEMKLRLILKMSRGVSPGMMTLEETKLVMEKIDTEYGPAHAYECYNVLRTERRSMGLQTFEFSNSEQELMKDRTFRENALSDERSIRSNKTFQKEFCPNVLKEPMKKTLLDRIKSVLSVD